MTLRADMQADLAEVLGDFTTGTLRADMQTDLGEVIAEFGAEDLPVFTVAPVISGSTPSGSTLTCSTGTVTGGMPITYAYQWKSAGSNVGSNQNSYITQVSDETKSMTCVVTPTNAVGQGAPATSNAITVTAGGVTVYDRWSPYILSGLDTWYTFNTFMGDDPNKLGIGVFASALAGTRITFKPYTTGKFFHEVKLVQQGATDRTRIGLVRDNFPLVVGNLPGELAGSIAYKGVASPVIRNGGASTVATASAAVNDWIGQATDLVNGTVQWFKNGTSLHAPIAIDGWVAGQGYYPAVGFVGDNHDQEVLANFGQTAFAYPGAVPAGFTAGWPMGLATWDPTQVGDGSHGITYSDGNSKYHATGKFEQIANVPTSYGIHYFEMKPTSGATDSDSGAIGAAGIANGDIGAFYLGQAGKTYQLGQYQGNEYDGTGTTAVTGSPADNVVLGFLLNLGFGSPTATLQHFIGNVSTHAAFTLPPSGYGGPWFAASGKFGANGTTVIMELITDPALMTYPTRGTDAGATLGLGIVANTPVQTAAAVVTGTASPGSTLTATAPTWTGYGTKTRNWCVDGVVSDFNTGTLTYVVDDTDAGHTITFVESMYNDFTGTTGAASNGIAIPP